MSLALYKNNADSITAASIFLADLSVTVAAGDGALFPVPAANEHFIVTLTDSWNYEIVRVSANAADALTIVRAQEGTTARDWPAGTTISQRLTAAAFQSLLDLEGTGGTGAQQSVRAGFGSVSSGASSAAVGRNCTSSGSASVAMGDGCTASSIDSVASGNGCSAAGARAVSIGRGNTAAGDHGTSIGNSCTASGYFAVSVGLSCTSSDYKTSAIGYHATASGSGATSVGYRTFARGSHAVAIGYSANSGTGADAIAIGTNAKSTNNGINNVAIGNLADASTSYGIAIGKSSFTGWSAVAIGAITQAGGSQSIAVGEGSTAPWDADISIGFAARTKAGAAYGKATAIGKSAHAYGLDSIAIGTNSQAYESRGIAIGPFSTARYRGVAVGLWAYAGAAAGQRGNVAVGTNSYAQGGNYATSTGYRARSYAKYGCTFGAYAYNYALAAAIVGTYSYAGSAAVKSSAFGYKAKVYGAQSVAVGAYKVNNLASSTMIANPITVSKDTGSVAPARDFAAAEVVLMSNEVDLTAMGTATIALPAGGIFLPKEIGIVCSTFGATIVTLTQATVEASLSTNGVAFTPVQVAAITTALSAARTFESLISTGMTQGATHLRASVTIAGSAVDALAAPQLYKGRMFFKGIFMEE